MKHVIFTADDFGLTPEVNAAVAEGHRSGVLSCASLMIAAPAAAEAVALARTMPALGVGLHVVVADGAPLLPPSQIPDLVDGQGNLPSNLVTAGVQWFFSPKAQVQLRAEIAAQFAAFQATGLRFDHVNAHNHMHLHPTVLGMIIDLAREYGVRHVRLPYEPGAIALAPWVALVRWRLARAGLSYNDWLAGLADTGHMTEARVLAALDALPDGVTEFYFHPAVATSALLETNAPGYDRLGELAALTSSKVFAKLQHLGLKQCVFSDLR